MSSKSSTTKNTTAPKDGVTAVEGAVRTFSELYEDAKQRIISNVLAHAEKYPNSPFSGTPLTRLEKAMRGEYERLGVDISQEFRDTLPQIMKSFYDSAIVELAKDSASGIIGEIDKGRINYFLQDSFESVAGATNRMAVTHIRELRRVSADIFRRTSISGENRKQVSRSLLREAMNIPGFQFIDKAGSKWQAKNYFEMLARTQLMEAGRESYQDGCVKAGCDIVRVSVSGHSCPKCARFENRLLSISGNTPGLPTVSEARSTGLFHPNCTHSLIAVPDYIAKTDYDEYGLPKSGYNSHADNTDELSSGHTSKSSSGARKTPSDDSTKFQSVFASDDKSFNEIMTAELASAPEDLQQAALTMPSVKNIESANRYGYVHGRNTIKTKSEIDPVALLHEWGHHFDLNLPDTAQRLRSGNFEVILKEYEESLVKSGIRQEIIDRLNSLPMSSEKERLLDYFGAITKNKIGYGHDITYLNKEGAPGYEAFANMTALYVRNGEEWKLLSKYTNDLAATFRQILSKTTQNSK